MAASITDFDFDIALPNLNELSEAWLCAIETAAERQLKCPKTLAFFIALAKLVVKTRGINNRGLKQLEAVSGYSKSTFFRMFPSYKQFLLLSYQMSSDLTVDVYIQTLDDKELSIEEFSKLTTDIFYGAHCVLPNGFTQLFWPGMSQAALHPHLDRVVQEMVKYLHANPKTASLKIETAHLAQYIKSMDWDILRLRHEATETFPNHEQYWRFRHALTTALLSYT